MQHQIFFHTLTLKINNSTTTMDLKEIINSIVLLPSAEQNKAQIEPKEHRSTVWRRQKGITSSKHEGYEKQRLLRA